MNALRAITGRALHAASERRQLMARRVPEFQRAERMLVGNSRTVYYLCPDTNSPTGGVRVIYKHVDMLNSLGIKAAVLHHQSGFSCTWFSHETKIVAADQIALSPADLLVVPEFYGPSLKRLPNWIRVVLFNQNCYQMFTDSQRLTNWPDFSAATGVKAMLVVSTDNLEYMRYALPRLRIERIRNSLDSNIFYPQSERPGRRIGVMPRRRGAHWREVHRLLSIRGVLNDWEVVSIDGNSEAETADLLRSCSIFLSFSEREGFGLPPAEAMACGCYVVGYTGFAGREYFDADYCVPVEEGNVLAFAKAIEEAVCSFGANGSEIHDAGVRASRSILKNYSPELQSAELEAFYSPMLE